jgi:hypothetical protein
VIAATARMPETQGDYIADYVSRYQLELISLQKDWLQIGDYHAVTMT